MTIALKNGMYSGILLLCILFFFDLTFNTNTVYLLLNVDFLTKGKELPFVLDLLFHFITSFILYIIIFSLYKNKFLYSLSYIFLTIIFYTLYYVLSYLAQQQFLENSLKEIIAWMIGHIIYLIYVHITIVKSYSR